MLSKRTNSYEIQKPISPSKVPVRTSSNNKNSSNNKMTSSSSGSSFAQHSNSGGTVHSNSFNFSQSRSSVTSVPSSISSRAVQAPVRRSLRNSSATTNNGNTKQPKMGVPMMTSTPARSLKSAEYISSTAAPSIDEEPIYCEIPSPNKRPLPPPPLSNRSSGLRGSLRSNGLSSVMHQQHNQQQGNGAAPTRMLKTNGAITSGLGRRAITQLDMSAASRLSAAGSSSRPVTARQPSIPSAKWLPQENFQFPNPTSSNYGLGGRGGSEVAMLLNSADGPLSSSSNNTAAHSSTTSLLKGVLWQQREKRFSRWKERFFILTNDYLQCFRRGTSKLSEMGTFIFRIRLCEIEEVDLVERRGYLTLRILVKNEAGRLLLRKTDGIRKWFQLLQETITSAKQRRLSMKSSEQFWAKRQHTDSSAMESWVLARQRVGQQYCWSDTASCISETASTTILPNHLRSTDITSSKTRPTSGNLETASAVAASASAVGRKSYNNLKTTHYGLIDWPSPKAVLATSNEKRPLTSSPRGLPSQGKLLQKELMVNQSHDSGVDSMNTNSSGENGSMMSSSECSSSRQKSPSSILLDPEKFSRQITLV